MHVASLHRFPVKGAGVPHNRRFMLRGDTAYDPASTRWVAKEKCVMLVRDHALARLRLRFDPDTIDRRGGAMSLRKRGGLGDAPGRRLARVAIRPFESSIGRNIGC
jgi:hypothetical protein